MGIHDRDYIRERPELSAGQRGAKAVGGWSVNTWLIVICIAVFVIDGFTPQHRFRTQPAQLVPGNSYFIEGLGPVPNAVPRLDAEPQIGPHGIPAVPLVDPASERVVGFTEVFPLYGLLSQYLHFSTQRGFLQIEFWRLIGFQFLHASFWHLLFNMVGLFFFGPLVERHLGSKRYLAFYLLCGICGALLYSMLNVAGWIAALYVGEVRIPGLLFNDPFTPLVGASAGVFGVLMAGAYLAPNAMVLLFFFIPMRLWLLAYALVGFALFSLIAGRVNAGGEAGHLGGALAGFYLIRNPRHLHGFFDFLGRADPTSHHYKQRQGASARGQARRSGVQQREVDRILDKISREGIQSPSDEEKRVLRDASRR